MFIEVNQTKLYYETHGEGQPLFMLHGGMGLDHTCYWPAFEPLTNQAQVILYELGTSTGHPSPLYESE